MSGTSGRISRTPFAFYDPDSQFLRTSQGTFDLDSTPSSPTLPASGSMRSGALYAHRRSALPTSATDSSSSPQLPTPRARDSRGLGFEDGLPNVVQLLPTPRTSDTNGAGTHGTGGPDLRTTVSLLPTPRASDGEKGGPNQRGSKGDLALPAAVVQLLPTPTVADSRGTRNATAGRQTDNPNVHLGWTLTDVAYSGQLLPTGADSAPPSAAGKPSPDDELPGQLMIEIG